MNLCGVCVGDIVIARRFHLPGITHLFYHPYNVAVIERHGSMPLGLVSLVVRISSCHDREFKTEDIHELLIPMKPPITPLMFGRGRAERQRQGRSKFNE